jgi:hypothetical protein
MILVELSLSNAVLGVSPSITLSYVSSLSTLILSETNRAISSERSISTVLSSEISRAISTDNSLSIVLSSEISRAISTDTFLSSNISRVSSTTITLSNSLSVETSRAIATETSLSSIINNNYSDASGSAIALSISISLEKARALIAETSINNYNQYVSLSDLSGSVIPLSSVLTDYVDRSTKQIINGEKTFTETITAVGFNSNSDYRIKKNVTNLTDNYTIDQLRPVKYYNTMNNKEDFGLIAHEVQSVYPEIVTGQYNGIEIQSVNYISLIPILINEIQMLKKELLKKNNEK